MNFRKDQGFEFQTNPLNRITSCLQERGSDDQTKAGASQDLRGKPSLHPLQEDELKFTFIVFLSF